MEEIKTDLTADHQVAKHIKSSQSQVWALVKKNPTFPKPLQITARMTRWLWADVLEWEKSLETQ